MELTMNHVKVVREEVGMKQCDLAKKLKINQSNYANMEKGKLFTKKIPNIINEALLILVPKLDEKLNEANFKHAYLKTLRKEFKNY